MNYNALRKNTNTGWNTWNTHNVLSYAHLPEGFAINLCIKEFSSQSPLRESLIGRHREDQEQIFPGARSYDGSCTRLNLKFRDMELDVRTVVSEDEQFILLTPLKTGRRAPVLVIEACLLWGRDGSISKSGNQLRGDCGGRRFEVFTTAPTVPAQHTGSLSPYIAVCLDRPLLVSTRPCSLEEAEALYASAKEKLDRENSCFGIHSESYTAMKTCLAWDTIYEPEHDRVCSPVSRIWNLNFGGYVLFDWDTYFAALMASVENKELAQLNAIAITEEATERGFVPNFGCADNTKSRDRSQPPVGSAVCLQIYRRWPEEWFLGNVFPTLLSWNRWFGEHRTTREGYMCWGSDPYEPVNGRYFECNDLNNRLGAALESGLDNSPMYDDAEFDEATHMMKLADVGLMGLYIHDCRCMMELARILGRGDVIGELEGRKARVEAALESLWDEEFGMFLNLDLAKGVSSRRISPTNFYALYSDRVTDTQKQRMLSEHLFNPEEFWGEYMIPTISRNDPCFPIHGYWQGRIWAPTNYLTYEALKYAGERDACSVLARKSEELLLKEWRLHGHVHENYSCYDGLGCGMHSSDKFYHWGGLLAYIALDHDKMI